MKKGLFIALIAAFMLLCIRTPLYQVKAEEVMHRVFTGYFDVKFTPVLTEAGNVYRFIITKAYENSNYKYEKISEYSDDKQNRCIYIAYENGFFEDKLKFDTEYSLTVAPSDIKIQIAENEAEVEVCSAFDSESGSYLPYACVEGVSDEPELEVMGYFEKDLGTMVFLPETLGETRIYSFKVLENKRDDVNKISNIKVLFEKDFFDSDLGFDKSYSFLLFDTGLKYESETVYTLYYYPKLGYFTETGFGEYEKDKVKKERNADFIKEHKSELIIMLILVIGSFGALISGKRRKSR